MVSQWLALFQFLVALWTLVLVAVPPKILGELKGFVRDGLRRII